MVAEDASKHNPNWFDTFYVKGYSKYIISYVTEKEVIQLDILPSSTFFLSIYIIVSIPMCFK